MSLAFDIRTVLVELKDAPRLGMATKRFEDLLQSLVNSINQLVAITGFSTAAPSRNVAGSIGSAGTSVTVARSDHSHQSTGGISTLPVALPAISGAEQSVLSAIIPANFMHSMMVFGIQAYGTVDSTTNDDITIRLRVGPTTLTGVVPGILISKPGNSGTASSAGFLVDMHMVIRPASGAYAFGQATSLASGLDTQAFQLANSLFTPGEVSIDPTVTNLIELTCETANATVAVTFQAATISVVKL